VYNLHKEKEMVTEFSKKILILMVERDNMAHKELAKSIGCSSAFLSNILTGKTSPSIDFIIRCKEYFNLSVEATIDLFRSAFSSSPSIFLDPSNFNADRREALAKLITFVLLYPETNKAASDEEKREFDFYNSMLNKKANEIYDGLLASKKIKHYDKTVKPKE
jgi:transcriptional regulator with XRE-family HTH domain